MAEGKGRGRMEMHEHGHRHAQYIFSAAVWYMTLDLDYVSTLRL